MNRKQTKPIKSDKRLQLDAAQRGYFSAVLVGNKAEAAKQLKRINKLMGKEIGSKKEQ